MKRLIPLLLTLALLTGCGSKTPAAQNSAPTTAPAQPTEAKVTVECVTGVFYTSADGDETGAIRYEADGIHLVPDTTGSRYETVLDSSGKEIYELCYNDENILTYRTDYTYDQAGNLVEWLNYDTVDDEVASRTTHIYDENGCKIKIATNHRNDIPGGYQEFIYDANGHIAGRSYTDMDGNSTWNYTYTCDDSGRIISGSILYPLLSDSEPVQLGYYTLSYDEGGRIIAQRWTETQRSFFVHYDYFYDYNEAGLLVESRTIDDDGEIKYQTKYTYDSNNRLTGIEYVDEGAVVTFVYSELTLPADLAESAAAFTASGMIHYYAPLPEYQH